MMFLCVRWIVRVCRASLCFSLWGWTMGFLDFPQSGYCWSLSFKHSIFIIYICSCESKDTTHFSKTLLSFAYFWSEHQSTDEKQIHFNQFDEQRKPLIGVLILHIYKEWCDLGPTISFSNKQYTIFLIRVWWLWGTVKLLSPFKASMNSFYQYIFYRTRKTFNWLLWDGTLNGREDCGLSVYLKIHSKYTRWRIKWIEVIMILIQGLLSEAEITEGFRVVSMNLHGVLWRQIHLDYMIVSKVFFMQMAA